MKIGILGAGNIAVKMAKTVSGMKDVENYAVAARNLERAQAFARENGVAKAYGSYEEMLADPQIDLVYIATPHSHHYLHAKMCLEAGKNVLCEKAFTVNADHTITWDGTNRDAVLTELTGTKVTGEITFTENKTEGSLNADVVNNKGSELPSTGGMGTTIFYVVGSILVLGAAILLITKKRMSAR